ncbi:hypothetical protein [Agrilutibacter solisilvae]|uniref:RHS repeat protein n=1 Tax=Agrilutibacter solisilvae TaxID=2763317 RepID=A0A974Y1K0_9GAMM|nr:hypothetical protein [Lysobacter solisilvae]QSX79727.1 hypothetical protein I8J32_007785 [Lysobacter solisilvae]
MKFLSGAANRGRVLCTLFAISATLALAPKPAQAQMSWGEEYARRVRATEQVSPLGDDAFGDSISLYNGTVSFKATDISLPGNNALPVRLSRYYDPQDVSLPHFLGTWDLDIPHISAVAPSGHNGGFPVPQSYTSSGVEWQNETYWSGNRLNMGGSGSDLLTGALNDPKRSFPSFLTSDAVHTKDGWYFSAIPVRNGAGYGYKGYAPDGTIYTFDWMLERDYSAISHPTRTINGSAPILYRKKIVVFVSKIEDRFGNWVKYEWDEDQGEEGRLNRIHSSDGREIVLTMVLKGTTNYDRKIWGLTSATAAGRTWSYDGENVTNPDLTRWTYRREGHRLDTISYERIDPPVGTGGTGGYIIEEEVACSPAQKFEAGQLTKYFVTHPSGAQAEYTLKPMRHGRTNVPFFCDGGNPQAEQIGGRNGYATYHDVWSLQSKKVTGVGLDSMDYAYSYEGLAQGYEPPENPNWFPYNEPGWIAANVRPLPNRKTVTVVQPDGTKQIHTFGKDYGVDDGFLLQVQTLKDNVVYRTVTHGYVTEAEALALPFPENMGFSGVRFADKLPYANRPMKSTTIVQDSQSWTSAVASTCNGNNTLCFDRLARSTVEMKYNSMGSTRSDATEYYDRTDLWVLGQVLRTLSVAGGKTIENVQTDYDTGNALPLATYGPCLFPDGASSCAGKRTGQMTYRFDPKGVEGSQNATLATVADGRGNVTTLTEWMRGIPQKIQHPATPGASAIDSIEQALVNADGTLAWVEDELDNRTCYTYVAGRLDKVTYPSEATAGTCDESKWLSTTFKLELSTTAAYGLPAGHWRAIRSARAMRARSSIWIRSGAPSSRRPSTTPPRRPRAASAQSATTSAASRFSSPTRSAPYRIIRRSRRAHAPLTTPWTAWSEWTWIRSFRRNRPPRKAPS